MCFQWFETIEPIWQPDVATQNRASLAIQPGQNDWPEPPRVPGKADLHAESSDISGHKGFAAIFGDQTVLKRLVRHCCPSASFNELSSFKAVRKSLQLRQFRC